MPASTYQHYLFRILTFALFAFLLYAFSSSIPSGFALYKKDSTFLILPASVMLLTWYYLKMEKKTLDYVGLDLSLEQAKFFFAGLLIGLLQYVIVILFVMLYSQPTIHINNNLLIDPFLKGIIFLASSAVFEELIFRGYIFKKLYESIGAIKSLLITGFCFAIYHWVAWGILGNWPLMLLAMITTGLGHLIFATALVRSGSLYLAIGIHYSWNVSNEYLWFYKSDPSSSFPNFLFILTGGQLPLSYFTLVFMGVGLATVFAIHLYYSKRAKSYTEVKYR
jgi:membrane protease YdiL (CAAX protease family)